jgi:hypothetical protein
MYLEALNPTEVDKSSDLQGQTLKIGNSAEIKADPEDILGDATYDDDPNELQVMTQSLKVYTRYITF